MEIEKNTTQEEMKELNKPKKPYEKPSLIYLGDLRCEVLGGTAGTGESGAPLIRKTRRPGATTINSSDSSDPAAPTDPGAP